MADFWINLAVLIGSVIGMGLLLALIAWVPYAVAVIKKGKE